MSKSLNDIALNITEDEYRNDGCMHYSTLATYERGGFGSIETLGERKESDSLTFGSAVDALITGGQAEFDTHFIVAEFPKIEPAVISIIKTLFDRYKEQYRSLTDIPNEDIISLTEEVAYQSRWKPETRATVIREKGAEYYNLLKIAEDKTILSTEMYNDVMASVRALKESPATRWYFMDDNPFDDSLERVYQPKFRASFDGVEYSCMMDLVVVDHANKVIYPCDLKTSSHTEYDFFHSFIQWSYYIQAAEYAAILKANIEKDDYFKDFKMMPYRFIVVNKKTLNPLVWEWAYTYCGITVEIPTNGKTLRLRNFREIGKELHQYLEDKAVVPEGIILEGTNDIEAWIKKM